jgi:hypothetical protein
VLRAAFSWPRFYSEQGRIDSLLVRDYRLSHISCDNFLIQVAMPANRADGRPQGSYPETAQ